MAKIEHTFMPNSEYEDGGRIPYDVSHYPVRNRKGDIVGWKWKTVIDDGDNHFAHNPTKDKEVIEQLCRDIYTDLKESGVSVQDSLTKTLKIYCAAEGNI